MWVINILSKKKVNVIEENNSRVKVGHDSERRQETVSNEVEITHSPTKWDKKYGLDLAS